MRTPLIIGNWKLNTTPESGRELARAIRLGLGVLHGRDVVLCPPFTSLAAVAEEIRDSKLLLGGQDMHWESKGAFTGEVSGEALRALGCRFVLIGHSERRQFFGETDDIVNKKLKQALATGLVPVVCLGERLEEREAELMFSVVERQLAGALAGIDPARLAKGEVVIAYEPVWAIGTGRTASPAQAEEIHRNLRELLTKRYESGNLRILYGGSVKADTIEALMAENDIDGVLVGGASLETDSFVRIAKYKGANETN